MKQNVGPAIAGMLGIVWLLAACAAPEPPRPAMQALAAAGNFGYADRSIDADTIEVTYRGPEVSLSTRDPRDDSRLAAEKLKVRDLALLRAARLASEQGGVALRIVNERVDSDVDARSNPRCRVAPIWGAPGVWGLYGYRPYGGFGWSDPDYYCYERRWATGRAMAVLVVDILATRDSTDTQQLPVAETIARLEKAYAGATYP